MSSSEAWRDWGTLDMLMMWLLLVDYIIEVGCRLLVVWGLAYLDKKSSTNSSIWEGKCVYRCIGQIVRNNLSLSKPWKDQDDADVRRKR